mmetsp:Transcript_154/g.341  ORF Transcript_154/g.341 Transcript_154/m.341 type:complete len:150 (+) Transcript_154:564-1013(+)
MVCITLAILNCFWPTKSAAYNIQSLAGNPLLHPNMPLGQTFTLSGKKLQPSRTDTDRGRGSPTNLIGDEFVHQCRWLQAQCRVPVNRTDYLEGCKPRARELKIRGVQGVGVLTEVVHHLLDYSRFDHLEPWKQYIHGPFVARLHIILPR